MQDLILHSSMVYRAIHSMVIYQVQEQVYGQWYRVLPHHLIFQESPIRKQPLQVLIMFMVRHQQTENIYWYGQSQMVIVLFREIPCRLQCNHQQIRVSSDPMQWFVRVITVVLYSSPTISETFFSGSSLLLMVLHGL